MVIPTTNERHEWRLVWHLVSYRSTFTLSLVNFLSGENEIVPLSLLSGSSYLFSDFSLSAFLLATHII